MQADKRRLEDELAKTTDAAQKAKLQAQMAAKQAEIEANERERTAAKATRSTKPKISVEVCSKCHPFFTGSVKFVDAAGRVDKFNKKFAGKYGKTKPAVEVPAKA